MSKSKKNNKRKNISKKNNNGGTSAFVKICAFVLALLTIGSAFISFFYA